MVYASRWRTGVQGAGERNQMNLHSPRQPLELSSETFIVACSDLNNWVEIVASDIEAAPMWWENEQLVGFLVFREHVLV